MKKIVLLITMMLLSMHSMHLFSAAASQPQNSAAAMPNALNSLNWWQQGLLLTLMPQVNNVVVRTVLPPIAKALGFVGSTMNFFVRISQKGYNQLCRRPDPLRAEEVQIWESMIENITSTLCEQSISGTIMMRNRIMSSDEDEHASEQNQWAYYVTFVSRMLLHITMNLEQRIPYYRATKKQREMLVTVANAVSLDDRKSIAFLIQIIADNLRHIVEVCKNVSAPDDLNTEHIKKVSRNTLMLLKKLREMIGSQSKQDSFGINNFDSGAGQANGKLV